MMIAPSLARVACVHEGNGDLTNNQIGMHILEWYKCK